MKEPSKTQPREAFLAFTRGVVIRLVSLDETLDFSRIKTALKLGWKGIHPFQRRVLVEQWKDQSPLLVLQELDSLYPVSVTPDGQILECCPTWISRLEDEVLIRSVQWQFYWAAAMIEGSCYPNQASVMKHLFRHVTYVYDLDIDRQLAASLHQASQDKKLPRA